jgi:hypothetical protein
MTQLNEKLCHVGDKSAIQPYWRTAEIRCKQNTFNWEENGISATRKSGWF